LFEQAIDRSHLFEPLVNLPLTVRLFEQAIDGARAFRAPESRVEILFSSLSVCEVQSRDVS
jgi:hypothetical protein